MVIVVGHNEHEQTIAIVSRVSPLRQERLLLQARAVRFWRVGLQQEAMQIPYGG